MSLYTVSPNNCRCHPETCACNPWAVLDPKGKKITSTFRKEAADDIAKTYNQANNSSTSTAN